MALNWTDMETKHLQKMYNFFEDERTEQMLKETDIFFYKWYESAMSDLGWDDDLIASMYMEGYKLLDKKGSLEIISSSTKMLKTFSESDSKCDCLTNQGMLQPESCNIKIIINNVGV